jgi:signal transduction histidine kinase
VSVNELFEQVWGDMADRLKVNVVKHLRLDPSQPRILGNVAQIQVAIRMLMQNALEAMPDGGRLFYWTSVRGGHVSIRVGDTGKGMDKHTKERCLEPFYTTKTKGTGLGLAVVVTIARQHHAELSVVSKQGKGTLWKLRFPKAGD